MEEFQFKAFEQMTQEDYAKIGFKSGLEVHQQLLTSNKLFCKCPAGKYSNHFHSEILRHMRPTLSELGEYDATSLMEFKTKKSIIYRINRNNVCTYEMDESPPFKCNEKAIDIVHEIASIYNSYIVDEIHITRKHNLDGSIPTGFQRTAILALDGYIPYKNRNISIIQVGLEEDSCREFSDIEHKRVFMTDRLGIPLIETVTEPEMQTPEELADVCNIIRKIARATGKVRTGIGTSRQDINISIKGGTRIEIKGVQSIKRIPMLAYYEAMRQWNLLKIRDELNKRGINKDTFEAKIDDVTHILKKTQYQPIANAIATGKLVKSVILRNFNGILNLPTQIDTQFARELSDRVRVIACLTTLPNLCYSDSGELSLTSAEGQRIRKLTGASENDTIVLVWGDEEDSILAANEIVVRAKEATVGVPPETRKVLPDNTNAFERILPGPERMYPDTDLPPIKISKTRINEISKNLPVLFWEREKKYTNLDLPEYDKVNLATSEDADLFEELVFDLGIDAKLVAIALLQYKKKLIKEEIDPKALSYEAMKDIFIAYKNNKLVKDGIYYVMKITAKNGVFDEILLPKIADRNEFISVFYKKSEELQTVKFHNPQKMDEYLFGQIMSELYARINGYDAKIIFNELLSKGEL